MAAITYIGHVGIYCDDLEKQKNFYTRVLGFKVTDPGPRGNGYFLSAQPDAEHHQVLLMGGGRGDGKLMQQLSFHTGSVGEVREYWRRLVAEGAQIAETITHGNAVSVYFYDPEGNRLEIYWDTGILCHQPFKEDINLDADDENIMAQVNQHVDAKGRVWDPALV
ncbi:MAG TPA: VOC family protein [Chloroflexota bacterium]|jgi:catechol 2,3-dioxygenase-like lactoylglutathione lyase family enzyme